MEYVWQDAGRPDSKGRSAHGAGAEVRRTDDRPLSIAHAAASSIAISTRERHGDGFRAGEDFGFRSGKLTDRGR